jgi:tRNA U34 2-thiouridine synthase MnmA/TrmU
MECKQAFSGSNSILATTYPGEPRISRYRRADARCALSAASGSDFHLDLSEPQWTVTPGQSVVLYDGEVCLGGGVISAKK